VHGFADEEFAEHGAEGCAAVAPAREGRGTGSLELNVHAALVRSDLFSEENGAAVAEGGEVSVLVAGVGLAERMRSRRQGIAREDGDSFRRGEVVGIQSKFACQRCIEDD